MRQTTRRPTQTTRFPSHSFGSTLRLTSLDSSRTLRLAHVRRSIIARLLLPFSDYPSSPAPAPLVATTNMPPRAKARGRSKATSSKAKATPHKSKASPRAVSDAGPDDAQDDTVSPDPQSKKRKNGSATLQSDPKKRRGDSAKPEPTEVDWEAFDNKHEGFKVETATPEAAHRQTVEQPSRRQTDAEYDNGSTSAKVVQKNPYSESSISKTHYAVTPAAEWESTMRFRKCTSKDMSSIPHECQGSYRSSQRYRVRGWSDRFCQQG